jgi:carboxylesterase type B
LAKSGNPSHPALEWKPYSKEDPQAMVFDTVSQSVAFRDDTLDSLLRAPAGRDGGRGTVVGGD